MGKGAVGYDKSRVQVLVQYGLMGESTGNLLPF